MISVTPNILNISDLQTNGLGLSTLQAPFALRHGRGNSSLTQRMGTAAFLPLFNTVIRLPGCFEPDANCKSVDWLDNVGTLRAKSATALVGRCVKSAMGDLDLVAGV